MINLKTLIHSSRTLETKTKKPKMSSKLLGQESKLFNPASITIMLVIFYLLSKFRMDKKLNCSESLNHLMKHSQSLVSHQRNMLLISSMIKKNP